MKKMKSLRKETTLCNNRLERTRGDRSSSRYDTNNVMKVKTMNITRSAIHNNKYRMFTDYKDVLPNFKHSI